MVRTFRINPLLPFSGSATFSEKFVMIHETEYVISLKPAVFIYRLFRVTLRRCLKQPIKGRYYLQKRKDYWDQKKANSIQSTAFIRGKLNRDIVIP